MTDALLYELNVGIVRLEPRDARNHEFTAAVRDDLMLRLAAASADPAVKAIVILMVFGQGPSAAGLTGCADESEVLARQGLCETIVSSPKPVVAAIEGCASGAWLELALASAFRVADRQAQLGFPELRLGMLPAGGSLHRITRLIGPAAAMDVMLGGGNLRSEEAATLGLIDEVADGDVAAAGAALALRVSAEGGPGSRTSTGLDNAGGGDSKLFEEIRAKNRRKWQGLIAPFRIVDCIEAATMLDTQESLAFERRAYAECCDAPSQAAQEYLYFAEFAAAEVKGLSLATRPDPIRSAAVIGAGTMGGGIAMTLLNAGIPVKLLDARQDMLDAGMVKVEGNYRASVARGSLTAKAAEEALGILTPVLDYEDIGDVDLVIEAVFEDMTLKQGIFAKLDQVMRPGALLGTNTSTLDIDAIAGVTRRPQDVIGMHFFSPANVMKLLENVRGARTSDETIAAAMAFAGQVGKVPVLAGNRDGFIGNRILRVYSREAEFLLEEGATPWQVDNALKAFGFPDGDFLMRDMSGLDIAWQVRQQRAKFRDPAERYSPIADRICELGRFGQKTGAGYYRYEGRDATPDPQIDALIVQASSRSRDRAQAGRRR